MGEITLVTCFFDLGRGEDKNLEAGLRKTPEKYLNAFRHWARIQNKLIVYTDAAGADAVREIRKEFGREDKTIIIQIDDLFGLEPELFARMERISKKEDFLNFRYFQKASSNNPKYDYLWMMKYYFMNDALNRGLLSEQVAWVDFGFDHGGLLYYAEDFDFNWEYDFGDKIHIFCLMDPDSISGIQILQYLPDCVMGSMYGLPRTRVADFWILVRNAIEGLLALDCIDDDQLMVLMAYKARPELFKVYVTDWQMALKLCGGDHMRLREKKLPKAENKYKRAIRIFVRKFIKNPNEPKTNYVNRCYNMAVRFWGK